MLPTLHPRARLALLVLALAGLGIGIGLWIRSRRTPKFPAASIVLLSIDTLRADAVAGFGAPAGATPNLYILGNEGIRFRNAIAATHITAPSHATMLTGVSPFVHGMTMAKQGKAWPLPKKIPTLAEILRKAGYRTAAFTDGIQLLREIGFDRGFEVYEAKPTGLREKAPRIEQFIAESGSAPVFLFLHTYRPHQPYRTPIDLLAPLVEGYTGVFVAATRVAARMTHEAVMTPSREQNQIAHALSGERAETDADRKFFRRLYDAGVVDADREASEILGLLKKCGIYDDAVIAVTSDHGEEFFEHGSDSHHTVFEECLRVPMILRLPDGSGAGRAIDATFPSVDLVPTLLDLVGLTPGGPIEGISVARWCLRGEPPAAPAFAAWYAGGDIRWPGGCAIRAPAGKLITLDDPQRVHHPIAQKLGAASFFDFAADPAEAKALSIAGVPLARELRKAHVDQIALWKALRAHYEVDPDAQTQLDESAVEALRAIGYNK